MSDKASRTRMSDAQVEQYLTSHIKHHGWNPKEASARIRHCAATRWAALERHQKKLDKAPAKKAPAKKAKAKAA